MRNVVQSDEERDDAIIDREGGRFLPEEELVTLDEWERKHGRQLTSDDAEELAPQVAWCYVKWSDLQYEQGE
jgi:hypothetical protein